LGTLTLFFALIWSLSQTDGSPSSDHLSLYCAAGLQPPVEAAAREYEERYGVHIDITYGGSGTLLSNLKIAKSGDLYLPADESYSDQAQAEGLAREVFSLASMRPVIGVARGNPKGIEAVSDLLSSELRLGLANPDAAAIGRAVRAALIESGDWESISQAAAVSKPTVMDLANDLKLGTLDAAFIWDSTVEQYEELESVHLDELGASTKSVTLCVLESSERPTAALKFSRFLSARDAGLVHFKKKGYTPADGDRWDEDPELLLFSGGMLNVAIDDTIKAFEEREGLSVNRVYNGCGLLVSQMNAGASPDAYFSCDQSFLDMVAERFYPGTTVSSNRVVLLTKSGNPSKLLDLSDLCRPGLKVGLAHPSKSALGALSAKLLEDSGLTESFEASGNLMLDSATGDFLVNQMRTGSLDAVLVYRSNAAEVLEDLDLIEINLDGASATQPFAVARDSEHQKTLDRLLMTLTESSSRSRFDAQGFGWELSGEEGSE